MVLSPPSLALSGVAEAERTGWQLLYNGARGLAPAGEKDRLKGQGGTLEHGGTLDSVAAEAVAATSGEAQTDARRERGREGGRGRDLGGRSEWEGVLVPGGCVSKRSQLVL